MTENQVINWVNIIHRKYYGGDALRALEQPSAGMVQNSNYWFLQFSCAITDNETNNLKKIVGFGNPDLFGSLLGKGVQLNIDGKFKIVPDPFYQCLIIMAFDETLGAYVPVLYILMTVKTHWLYWHALHWVIVAMKYRLDPFLVTRDFKKPLHNAVREQFKHILLNGCLLHWKQTIQMKMKAKDIGIRDEQVSMAMTKTVMAILNIIPRGKISTKGIRFVRSILEPNIGAKYLEK